METRKVFEALGFEEVWGTMTDQDPAYCYDFGNLELTATQGVDFYLRSVFLLGGVAKDARSIMEIDSKMPLEVESLEQGVAWLAHGLHDFRPMKPTPWIEQGRQWADLLPWVRERKEHLKKLNAMPRCRVDRDWFRVAAKKLRAWAALAEASTTATFEFDGDILRIRALGESVILQAQGKQWEDQYAVLMSDLAFLPKRIMHDPVVLSIWESTLRIGNRSFALVDLAGMSARSPEK